MVLRFQLWQTDITYLKIIGWGWFYLSAILDDYRRYIISWKLCTNMRTQDLPDTQDLALEASGCDQIHVVRKTGGSSWVRLAILVSDLKKQGKTKTTPGNPGAVHLD